jgi:hypothetical protein
MVLWLIRMEGSSGKSNTSRLAISFICQLRWSTELCFRISCSTASWSPLLTDTSNDDDIDDDDDDGVVITSPPVTSLDESGVTHDVVPIVIER